MENTKVNAAENQANEKCNHILAYNGSSAMDIADRTKNGKICLNGGGLMEKPAMTTATICTNVAVPPDGGWGWVIVAASFCCNLIVDGIIYSFGMFLPAIVENFGQSKAKASLIGSLLSGSYLIAGPFASALANRYGFRKVTIIGAIITGFAFFISSFATSTEYLCVTYGVTGGIGFGLIFVPAVITIGFYFEKWRALATGIAVCGSGIGTFIMAPLSDWMIRMYTWKNALIIQAGIILLCTLCGALFRPLKHISVQLPISDKREKTNDAKESRAIKKQNPPFLVRNEKSKCSSLLNVHQDSGLTVIDVNSKHEQKHYFNINSKYPTVSQILQLDVIDDEGSIENCCGCDPVSRVPNAESSRTQKYTPTLRVSSNLELNSKSCKKSPLPLRERNKSVSPEMEKRNSIAPETRILLNRKYSLQPITYKSQSFAVSSSTTLASNKSSTFSRRHTDIGNRPLYKDDIFFNSNLKRLSLYNSQTSALNYTMSVTRLPTYTDVMEEKKATFTFFPESIRRALATLLDVSLLNSLTFIMLAISGFVTSMGMYTPFMYINDRAITFGIDNAEAVWLISIIGIANTIGRIGFGLLSSIPCMNAILINNISLTVCGVVTMCSGILKTSFYQFLYATVFGLTIACFASLRTIIIVDLLGLEKLTNAFGLLLLFQGIAAVIGPPVAGYFVDVTGSYELPFYLSGALITFSAIICYPIEILNNWEKNRQKKSVI